MLLEIENISKKYDDTVVLHDISFCLKPGVYGLLGSNGSGKTTLFRIICGVLKQSAGTVKYNHDDIQTNPDAFRSVLGFLPQDFSYYPNFTGMKFMLYIAALKGINKNFAKKRCVELLKLVGLDDVKNKKIKKYSGGMKQRLGIAQAMINDPEILILDEPTVGLDPKERVRFRNLISSFSENKIVILSTHIVSDVEYIADEILVLNQGKLENRGVSSELVSTIQGYVWEVIVEPVKLDEMLAKYIISNQKHGEKGIVLRIISKEKPTDNARHVQPTLEDLYLYYFRGEAEQ
ncbi:ABC transporter ATP-binding protein [Lederbergia galactosidilytica]|uniref:ABC transporter ATP-binding protein n=1 Tax=Lederbergia galactosidilytica TaxID=217031 RepID=A0A178A1J1_9BACI|nr:ABC transporter ATP-binding protein [Lederbergia galactosidilytica]KRG12254.1 ABC transporter ATP-binding protein [Virgibacillus soli]MBP1913945.1 ABC-2 type transport system ATP-binding protein [Lederbergia galactosidilytica]OAK73982.1 ABC transporter ATP-binding protein [Lederbergia galactosidilytica]